MHLNRRQFLAASACAAAYAFIPGKAPAAQTLSLTTAYMDRHPAYLGAFKPWMEEVNRATDGEIAIQYYNPNTICPEAGMLDAVAAGVADIGANAHGRTPGRFPRAAVLDLPLLFPDTATGSLVCAEMYRRFATLREESAQVKILWEYVSAPHMLHTAKKSVTSLEELKGLRIIAWAPLAVEALRCLGANPIQAVPHDSYLAVQRGMADGVLCPLSPLRSFKINEAARHTTDLAVMMDSFWVGMNPARWEGLDAGIKSVLEESVRDMAGRTGRALDAGVVEESALLAKSGHNFHSLGEEERLRWQQALSPVYDTWLKDCIGRGMHDAPELLVAVREITSKLAG